MLEFLEVNKELNVLIGVWLVLFATSMCVMSNSITYDNITVVLGGILLLIWVLTFGVLGYLVLL